MARAEARVDRCLRVLGRFETKGKTTRKVGLILWLARGRLALEPVMDLVGGFYLVRALGIDRAPTELLGRTA